MTEPPATPPPTQVIYTNGFSVHLTAADISIDLILDNTPVAKVKGSYTSMKTLMTSLQTIFHNFEKASGHPIMVMKDANDALTKMNSGGGN